MTTRIRLREAWRALWIGLAFALATPPATALADDARLERREGDVEVGRGDPPVWTPADGGTVLAPGDRLRTGADGRAELVWRGATIRLYGDSLLRLPAAGGPVALDSGSGLFDVKRREQDTFEVETPQVVVSVKGTRFGVTEGELWVYRGALGIRSLLEGAREVMVREGFRAVAGADGPAEVFLLDHADPWNDWIAELPPRVDLHVPAARLTDPAHRAVRRAARDRALALAVERNPKLARRLAKARNQLHRAMALERQKEDERNLLESETKIEPLLDATEKDAEMLLRSRFIEQALESPTTSLEVNLDSGGLLQIEDSTGQVWQLDPDTLVQIVEGTTSLPTGLDDALEATTVEDQVEVATMLLGLIGK